MGFLQPQGDSQRPLVEGVTGNFCHGLLGNSCAVAHNAPTLHHWQRRNATWRGYATSTCEIALFVSYRSTRSLSSAGALLIALGCTSEGTPTADDTATSAAGTQTAPPPSSEAGPGDHPGTTATTHSPAPNSPADPNPAPVNPTTFAPDPNPTATDLPIAAGGNGSGLAPAGGAGGAPGGVETTPHGGTGGMRALPPNNPPASSSSSSSMQPDPDAPPAEPGVRFVGRFDASDPTGPRFAWSGSGIIAAFEGQSVSVTLEDSGNNLFTVVLDGELQEPLHADSGSRQYELATGLVMGDHTIEIYRRTEAMEGVSRFVGFDFGPSGRLLAPPPPTPRRLEIIGDSITCGYGNEGADTSCGYTPETENHYLSYAAVSARALDADLITVAWSGKGIVYNYDTDTNEPLPTLYDRTVPTEGDSQWDFSVVPEAVVINLGTNDFSTDGDPTPELFHDEYAAFLEHLRFRYPAAFILCTVGPMLSGADLDAARAGIAAAVQTRNDAGDASVEAWEMNIVNDSPACDWHPSIATHQLMADALVAKLREELGW
jgi:lysophospholipase L1-like esterase